MLSAANINHGITLALIMLVSIALLIIAGLLRLTIRKGEENDNHITRIIVNILILTGISGLLYSFVG